MWVFDGEQWTDEGGSDQAPKAEQKQFRIDEMFLPELQVVEVVNQVPRTNRVPYPHP